MLLFLVKSLPPYYLFSWQLTLLHHCVTASGLRLNDASIGICCNLIQKSHITKILCMIEFHIDKDLPLGNDKTYTPNFSAFGPLLTILREHKLHQHAYIYKQPEGRDLYREAQTK